MVCRKIENGFTRMMTQNEAQKISNYSKVKIIGNENEMNDFKKETVNPGKLALVL